MPVPQAKILESRDDPTIQVDVTQPLLYQQPLLPSTNLGSSVELLGGYSNQGLADLGKYFIHYLPLGELI